MTIKQGLAVTDRGFWNPGRPWACWSISSVFAIGGSAGWAGQVCAKLDSHEVLGGSRWGFLGQ